MTIDTARDHTRRTALTVLGAASLLVTTSRVSFAAAAPVKIAMIGAGRMGSALGTEWSKTGHHVMFSSRHPEELKDLVSRLGANARAGTVAEAVAFSDVVVLLVPYSAIPQIAADFGGALAAKRLVMDVGNPIPTRDGDIGAKAKEVGPGLYLEQLIPHARIVRAFNAINYAKLPILAHQGGERTGVPLCGDDADALKLASALARDAGFEPVVVGPLAMGKYVMPGSPLAGEHPVSELRKLAADLH